MRMKVIGFVLCAMLLALCYSAQAQQMGKIPRIGYLKRDAGPRNTDKAFQQGLHALGWIEGKNIRFEYRWAAFKMDRLPALAKDLIDSDVDLIVTATQRVTRAAKNATTNIPIVMMYAANVVENGIVASLARPGGNITGLTEPHVELNTKLLELLHETLPKVKRVAFLWDSGSRVYKKSFRSAQTVAPRLQLTLESLELQPMEKTGQSRESAAKELAQMLAAAARSGAEALVVVSRIYRVFGQTIEDFANSFRIPVFSISRRSVREHFGLLAYSHDSSDMARRAAGYVDKILKGAKPADLPVQLPQKYRLLVNLKTAKQLGMKIPPQILLQATEVVR